jgi:hypothetical protein
LAVLGAAAIAAGLFRAFQLGGPLLAGLLVFPTLGYAAAPFNSWAAQRAALPAWLRERRRTEFRRDRRVVAAGAATGGLVAVFGAVVVVAALLFAPSHHPIRSPSLTGPGHSGGPAHGNGGPGHGKNGGPGHGNGGGPPAKPSRRPSPAGATPSAPATQPMLRQKDRAQALALSPDGAILNPAPAALPLVAAAAAAKAAGNGPAAQQLLRQAQAQQHAHPTYYGGAWSALGTALLTTKSLIGC